MKTCLFRLIFFFIIFYFSSRPILAQDAEHYDVIVVGLGGSGSAFVGHLLKEDEHLSILALEAGPLSHDERIKDPNQSLQLWQSEYNWKDTTVPQPHLNNRQIPYTAGRGTGGSTILNGTVWNHGHPEDYNLWEKAGNQGWNAKEMKRVLESLENYIDRPSHKRGKIGPITVFGINSYSPFSVDFVRSLESFGLVFNPDYNTSHKYGVSFIQQNINTRLERVDAFQAFVSEFQTLNRLKVISGAHVARILIENDEASGVIYEKDQKLFKAKANRYVALAAGTFRSPQVLMLSGIGDKKELDKVGILTVKDLPGVGKNLQEHANCIVARKAKIPFPITRTMQNIGFFNESMQISAVKAPKYQLQTYHIKKYPPYPEESFGIGISLQNTRSRGSISLKSASYQDAPLIDLKFLSDPQDKKDLIAGLKIAHNMLDHFYQSSDWLTDEQYPVSKNPTNSEWDEYIRTYAHPGFHAAGTCKMGPASDLASVVDHKLNVHGLSKLKVIDASIMPTLTTGNTMATALAIGKRGAEILLEELR